MLAGGMFEVTPPPTAIVPLALLQLFPLLILMKSLNEVSPYLNVDLFLTNLWAALRRVNISTTSSFLVHEHGVASLVFKLSFISPTLFCTFPLGDHTSFLRCIPN